MTKFLKRLQGAQLEKGRQIQDEIASLLQVAKNPPGLFDKVFGDVSGQGDEMDWARERLNKVTHGDGK